MTSRIRFTLGFLALVLCFATPAFSANVFYNAGKYACFTRDIDAATFKLVPVMTNTTADTENDGNATVADIATLDEFDGSGYSSGGITLTGLTVSKDDTNDRAELTFDNVSGLSYGDGTRQIAGFVLILFDTNLNSSIPVAFYDRTASPINGSDLSGFNFNAEGALQI
jgi:hypothetical protein